MTASGYRRICVKNVETGETYCGIATSIINNKTTGSLKYHEEAVRAGNNAKCTHFAGEIITNKSTGMRVKILSLDQDKYPPKISNSKNGPKKYRCGLFLNMETGKEFIASLSAVLDGYNGGYRHTCEERIEHAFNELGIEFEAQKRFQECLGLSRGDSRMRFDFFLPEKNLLIEYDGTQHTIKWDPESDGAPFSGGKRRYYEGCARDVLKEAWCVANGYQLLRIGYHAPRYVNSNMLERALETADKQFANGSAIAYYPENIEKNYESVHVIMSNLDYDTQIIFADHIADPLYRRTLDLPIQEDVELLMALPTDNHQIPIPICNHKQNNEYQPKRVRKTYKRGDFVGKNGVMFLSDKKDGKPIPPQTNGNAQSLFLCPCGNEFIATISSVIGNKSHDGKLCPECIKARRSKKMKEHDRRKLKYNVGDLVDPAGHFAYVSEADNSKAHSRRIIVRDVETGNIYNHNLTRLRMGKVPADAEKAKNRKEVAQRQQKYINGTIIENQYGKFEVIDDDYTKYTPEGSPTKKIKFKRLSDGKEFIHNIYGLVNNLNWELMKERETGDVIGACGVEFVSWTDDDGNTFPEYTTNNCTHKKQALFKCSCENHTLFVAPYDYVRDTKRVCPDCMKKREIEMRRKQGLAHRVPRIVGQPIDPDKRYIYLRPDNQATTRTEKCIVKDTVTGEIFSALFTHLRDGRVKPPSENDQARRNGHNNARKYNIGDIVSPDGNIRIVAELPPKAYEKEDKGKGKKTQLVRRFVFRNIRTGKLFEGTMNSVRQGRLTGARAKKIEADYQGIDIFPEPSDE